MLVMMRTSPPHALIGTPPVVRNLKSTTQSALCYRNLQEVSLMKRLFKILFGLVGAVVLLLVLAAVLLPLIYDKEDLKKAIAGQVYKQTGRELSINGALDFSVFPWVAVEMGDLSLSNAEGFGDQPFAKIGNARVGVALMPLLRKQISVDEITLEGLELAMVVNEKGQNNWDDLASGEESAVGEDNSPGMFSSQRVAGLNIRDANVEYRDLESGSHFRLSSFSMKTGTLGDDKPVPLELEALIEDVSAGSRAEFELAATAAIDLEAERYILDGFELTLALETGEGNQSVLIQAPQLSLDMAAQTLVLDSFTAELAGLQADGTFSARKIIDDPAFSGAFNIAEFSPVNLMQTLQMDVPVTADPTALQKASMNMNLSGNNTQLALKDFTMELDQSRFTGEVNVMNFDQPKITFQFAVDDIDLDRYMAPASEASGASASGSGDSWSEDVAIPQEELQGQDVQGQLKVGTLQMAGLEFSDAEVGILIRNGKLRVNPLTAGFYGGRYSGDIVLDGSTTAPQISINENIDSVAFDRLVADLVKSESLSGTGKGHVRLSGRGESSSEMLGSLEGDVGLTLVEGALEGINIWYEIRRGWALFKGMAPPEPEPNRTVFSRMNMVGEVENGVVNTRELIGELPFLTIRGDGAIDLGQSQVDLGMVAEVRNSPELGNDPLSSGLAGKSFPFKISGPLDAPSLSVDWAALIKGEATDMLIDKLGLGSKEVQEDAATGEQGDEESKAGLEETAKSALFDLLGGKNKDKDKDKD
jgi:AsmA protein